ncbi:DBH-like monooxygenase protein 1 homolog isoform X2 [Artemia franciscana]
MIKAYLLSAALFCTVFGAAIQKQQRVVVNDQYEFEWAIENDVITVSVTAATTGYAGFGIGPSGNMVNADLAVFGVLDGSGYLDDYYSEKNGAPSLDTELGGTSDWVLVEATEDETRTITTFSRKLVTSDAAFDQPILPGPTSVIWSLGTSDSLEYHGQSAGAVEVVFIEA